MIELNEKYGLVKKENHNWEKLTDIIIDYIFDKKGLANDYDMISDYPVITLDMLLQFYKYKHGIFSIPNNIIPDWISDFSLILKDPSTIHHGSAYVLSGTEHFKNDKINADIFLIYDINKQYNPDIIYVSIIHEFRHLYTHWLQYMYHFNIQSDRQKYIYTNYMSLRNEFKKINDDVCHYIVNLGKLLYYISPDELNAFMQSYNNEAKKIISNNIEYIKSIKQKIKNNEYADSDKGTPYESITYKRYMTMLDFINDMINKLDNKEISSNELTDISTDPFLRNMINAYMLNDKNKDDINTTLDWNVNLIHMYDDVNDDNYIKSYYKLADFIILFLKKIKKEYEKIIHDMDMLYIHEIRQQLKDNEKES